MVRHGGATDQASGPNRKTGEFREDFKPWDVRKLRHTELSVLHVRRTPLRPPSPRETYLLTKHAQVNGW